MALYAVTILVSAFLLFQIQPLLAKIILPWFGGSAGVWATSLLFFQTVLLIGYVYAHLLTKALRPQRQWIVHATLLAASLLFLPVVPDAAWIPSGQENPSFRIVALLFATIGLPYFLLSSTGPLIQAWFARRFRGKSPYRLYALSNAGSMLALVSYPIVVEPYLPTRGQASWWAMGYVVFAIACAATAYATGGYGRIPEVDPYDADPAPGPRDYFLWMAFAATASALLLAVTNHLSTNVAAMPFLWVLPLSLYLLSFIICFDRERWYAPDLFIRLLAVALGVMAYSLSPDFENASVKVMIPLFAASLFVCCMFCHGELARRKPHPRRLTSYYLMIALGGAVGGFFVAVVAPALFNSYYELPIAIAVCAILALVVLYRDSDLLGSRWKANWLVLSSLAGALLAFLAVTAYTEARGHRVVARNFYGGLKVTDYGDDSSYEASRRLTHGTITHGEQFLHASRRKLPTTYYGPYSGAGVAIRDAQQRGPMRLGVIGLGTGTLAAFGRPCDYIRFYEINPLVSRLAQIEFTYLGDSAAKIDIVGGDARVSLEREPPQSFDVLAVDAFSSDSIPVHLITIQAFQLYFQHLKKDGVLAVHISNKYLDLEPVVQRIAEDLRKDYRLVDTEDIDETNEFGSTWMLVAEPGVFSRPGLEEAGTKPGPPRDLRVWTDDYSNIFYILK